MTLQDAIEHLNDTLSDNNRQWFNENCREEHIQLRDWLIELQERRKKDFKTPKKKSCFIDTRVEKQSNGTIFYKTDINAILKQIMKLLKLKDNQAT